MAVTHEAPQYRALKPGDVLLLDSKASVQFVARTLLFRVIRVDPRPTYDGWVWLIGYSLDHKGNAVQRREVFVQQAGLRPMAAGSGTR